MTNLKEMLKMNKKKSPKEKKMENEELPKNEETVVTDKEAQTTTGEVSVEETKAEEKKEPTLEEKYNEVNDRLLRLFAEFDNYRKRTLKERIDLIKTSSEDMIISLLPVIDDLERAIKSHEEDTGENSMLEGVKLIHGKLMNILKLKGVEVIKTENEVFNTDFHEAIANVPAESEEMKGKIFDVVENGYLLNGKVIRFARVVVGS
jgi:molecular chaperone GrpE